MVVVSCGGGGGVVVVVQSMVVLWWWWCCGDSGTAHCSVVSMSASLCVVEELKFEF
jgi:hypothetical protein